MKKILTILVVAVMGASLWAPTARAEGLFRFGVKAGVVVNNMKFNEKLFDTSNRAGFTGGVTLQLNIPLISAVIDGSLMYVHRSNIIVCDAPDQAYDQDYSVTEVGRDYIEIPINLRWNLNLPAISRIVMPYIFTGPDFSFLTSKKNVRQAWNNKKFDTAWNFGFGLELLRHVQLQASYGLGLGNAGSGDASLYGKNPVQGKNRFWTVTAAYIF